MKTLPEKIKTNYEWVLDEIERASKASRYSTRGVKLVVVTKAQPVEVMSAAYAAGVRIFGENYPEETEAKIAALGSMPDATWHMIGHLQGRKAKIVAKSFDMMHSMDSLELAQKLNDQLLHVNRRIPVLLEVNIGGESSKFGFEASDPEKWINLVDTFQQISCFSNLEICGLMTMPPIYEEKERSRPFFVQMRLLQRFLRTHLPAICWDELSMGTSLDYTVAVEEGATYVRVGTAIVGERPR